VLREFTGLFILMILSLTLSYKILNYQLNFYFVIVFIFYILRLIMIKMDAKDLGSEDDSNSDGGGKDSDQEGGNNGM
jgi:hypothetical protein